MTLAEVERLIDGRGFPEPNSGCILWTGAFTPGGYAIFNGRRVTRLLLAATLERELSPTECACHRCDNPWCVNIDHLFVGSQNDNMQDAKTKGRLIGAPKLTPAQVEYIRDRLNDDAAQPGDGSRIARELGVSPKTISNVMRGRAWASNRALAARQDARSAEMRRVRG